MTTKRKHAVVHVCVLCSRFVCIVCRLFSQLVYTVLFFVYPFIFIHTAYISSSAFSLLLLHLFRFASTFLRILCPFRFSAFCHCLCICCIKTLQVESCVALCQNLLRRVRVHALTLNTQLTVCVKHVASFFHVCTCTIKRVHSYSS